MKHFLKEHWRGLIAAIIFPTATGILSSFFAGESRSVYNSFTLPPFSPPPWLFAVVWPVLYIFMGIASYLVFISPKSKLRKVSLILYIVQLFINFWWSIVFFRFALPRFAAFVVILLDILVIALLKTFQKVSDTSALLIYPYLLWILFAAYLNLSIILFN